MKKTIAMLLIALVAITGVFAQGSSEDAGGLETVRVAYMTNYASLCSLVAGIETGAFEEQGIQVELVEFADGPTIIAAMESGSIDIGYIGHGAHKLCVNGRAKIFAFSHVGNGDAVIGLRSHGVTEDPASLKGKSIGYASGTSSEQTSEIIPSYTVQADTSNVHFVSTQDRGLDGYSLEEILSYLDSKGYDVDISIKGLQPIE